MKTIRNLIRKKGLDTERIYLESEFLSGQQHARVGWGFYFFSHPYLMKTLYKYGEGDPFYVIIPSNAAFQAFDLPSITRKLLRKIPWWQRIVLASGFRGIEGVILTRDSWFIQTWKKKTRVDWIGYLDHPAFLGRPEEKLIPDALNFHNPAPAGFSGVNHVPTGERDENKRT